MSRDRSSRDRIDPLIHELARLIGNSVLDCDEVPSSMKVFELPPYVQPKMSVEDYIVRFVRKTKTEIGSMLYFSVLLQRVLTACNAALTRRTAHKCCLTLMVLGVKLSSDMFFSNSAYAKVGAVRLQDLNIMERAVLSMLDWQCQVSDDQWKSVMRFLTFRRKSLSGSEIARTASPQGVVRKRSGGSVRVTSLASPYLDPGSSVGISFEMTSLDSGSRSSPSINSRRASEPSPTASAQPLPMPPRAPRTRHNTLGVPRPPSAGMPREKSPRHNIDKSCGRAPRAVDTVTVR